MSKQRQDNKQEPASKGPTPEQALSLLDQAAGKAKLERNEHVLVQQAVAVLSKLIEGKKNGEDGK